MGIRRALSFAFRRGYRSKPLPRCSERSAILNGSGFSCGSLRARLACRNWLKHVFYALADDHLPPMLDNAIEHAAEGRAAVSADLEHGKDINS